MKQSLKDNRHTGLPSIQRIELSEKNKKARIVLLIVFVVIALVAFGFALFSSLDTADGWYSIVVESKETHCGDDFVFNYYVADADVSAKRQYDQISRLYSEATVKAYRVFHAKEAFGQMNNVYSINTHVGEELVIDEVLYRAFELMEQTGSRYLYLGALHDEYSKRFFGYGQAAIAEQDDPYVNDEMAMYFSEMAVFANDPQSIQLELLGENRVRLYVSDAYLAFAEEHGIEYFIDFFRLKNAFIADYLAEVMIENGYTYGAISSYDGYTRNLDRDHPYEYNLFDRMGNTVSAVAALTYEGGGSLVYLRSYPMSEKDSYFYYVSERLTVTPTVDIGDGLYKSATNGMIACAKELGCAEIALRLMPFYSAKAVDHEAMKGLTDQGIASVWCEDRRICYTQEDFSPRLLISEGEYVYEKQWISDEP